jgi:hypothetical protein
VDGQSTLRQRQQSVPDRNRRSKNINAHGAINDDQEDPGGLLAVA